MGGISILQRPAEETCPEVRIARKFWIFSQWTLPRSGQSKAFVLRKDPAHCGPEVFPGLCSQGPHWPCSPTLSSGLSAG